MKWKCHSCPRYTPHPSGLCASCRVELEMRRKFWRIPWHPQHVDLLEDDEEERRPRVEMPKEMEP